MTDEYKPRVLSLFSGCGGMDLGFQKEGYQTVWANDFFEEAVITYKKNIGDEIIFADITEIDPYTDPSIPDADIIIGGFPCQDFSMLGKRAGIEANRGNLFRKMAEFIDAKKPKAFVAENVVGIISANKGLALQYILDTFTNISPGYVVKYKIINFADYGVPQTRKRCIFVGVRADIDFDFNFPPATHGKDADLPWVTAVEALAGVEKVSANNELHESTKREKCILLAIPEGGDARDLPADHPYKRKDREYSNNYSRIRRDRPSWTLTATGGGGTAGYHHTEPRQLTNRERARIQTFPDDFVFVGGYHCVRKQIGNAVPPEGIRPIARALKPLFL